MNNKNRREFIKKIACLGAAGTGAHLTRLGLVSANAQSTSTYKALVCVFLFGGNDSNNMALEKCAKRPPQARPKTKARGSPLTPLTTSI